MVDRWYYAHDETKSGPCSAEQLKGLAACGRILPTDTIWKEGIENGVLARKVKHLSPLTMPMPNCQTHLGKHRVKATRHRGY